MTSSIIPAPESASQDNLANLDELRAKLTEVEARLQNPDPDFTEYTADELRAEITHLDVKVLETRDHEDGWLHSSWKLRRNRVQAELARRNGTIAQTVRGAPRSAITIKISDVVRENVTWLWQDRIPIGKLTMIEGDPGLGKSWLTLAIATAVSRGLPLPGAGARDPASVLLMTAEDGLGDTIRPRLEDMGAALERVTAIRGMINDRGLPDVLTLADLDVLEAVILAEKPRLVIVDPIIAFTAGRDTSKANEVRGLLSPLAALAEKHACAIVAVRHLNKSAAKAFYRGQGTIDFIAACRSAFVVGEDPENSADRVLCHLKSNLAPKTSSLVFTIDRGRFGWKGESKLTADQVLAIPGNDEKRTEVDECMDFLRTLLSSEPMPSPAVIKEAAKAGFSERTVWRAKKRLGVKASRKGFGRGGEWIWSLDANAELHTPPKSATVPGVADMAAYDESGSLWEVIEPSHGKDR